MRKRTILYLITQSELGGAQKYVFDLAQGLRNEYNIQVGAGEQGENGEIALQLKKLGIPIYVVPHLKRAISPFNDLMALLEIITLIKKIKPDVIHLNSSKISIIGSMSAAICSMLRVPCYVIYTAHGWVFNEPMSPLKKICYKYAEKFTAVFKDKIICVSEYDRQVALKEKIAPEHKLITIHNGIAAVDLLTKEEARKELLGSRQQVAGSECIIIGTIGNLYRTKGFEYLLEAANILKKSLPAACCLLPILGQGPERQNLEKLIKKYQLEDRILLAGRIDDAKELLPAFDIYVCSSVKEGLSYTIIEAMQAGLPIVATCVGGNPELIKNEKTGLLVEAKNPKILAEAILKLINNKALAQRLGQEANKKAREEFMLSKMINKTKTLYSASN